MAQDNGASSCLQVCLHLQVQLQEVVLDDLFDLPALTEYELFSMGRGRYR